MMRGSPVASDDPLLTMAGGPRSSGPGVVPGRGLEQIETVDPGG